MLLVNNSKNSYVYIHAYMAALMGIYTVCLDTYTSHKSARGCNKFYNSTLSPQKSYNSRIILKL